MLKTQVQLLTTQLTLLTEKRARKKKAKAAAAAASASKKAKAPRPTKPPGMSTPSYPKPAKSAPHKRARADLDPDQIEELTYDQKRDLSENINILTQDQLGRVLQIIRENTHIDEVCFYNCHASHNFRILEKKLNWISIHWISKRFGSCTPM